VNFGILPLEFTDVNDYDNIEQGDEIILENAAAQVEEGNEVEVKLVKSSGEEQTIKTKHSMSDRQIQVLIKGGIINDFKERLN
jgi:aconitate hydratase